MTIDSGDFASATTVPINDMLSEKTFHNSDHFPPKLSIPSLTASTIKATFPNFYVPVNEPSSLKVIQIGAGISGIQMCHKIAELENIDFKVYEKNSGLGGTWFENRYPGCACDIPAHSYSYTWAPNPNWSQLIVTAPEILKYLEDVVDKNGFRKYINFSQAVTGATWNEAAAKWIVDITYKSPLGVETKFQDYCDILVSSTGVLNVWKYPDIEGLKDYKGKLLHTASWDTDYDFQGKIVAVMGSGASSIQVTPEIQKKVKKLDVYIRSPTWMLMDAWSPIEKEGAAKRYTAEEIERFKSDPAYHLKYRKAIEHHVNKTWGLFYKNSAMQIIGKKMVAEFYKETFHDQVLRDYMTPSFDIGCRRPTSGGNFITAIQQPNAEVFKYGVTKMSKSGIIGQDGVTREYDAIVCATGFDTSFKPRFPIVGRRGHELQKDFSDFPEAYMGICVHGYPNYFMFSGPTAPVGNGSAYPGAELTSNYIIKFLRKVQFEGIRSWEVQKGPQDDFNEWAQSRMPLMVWSGTCNSWYKNSKTGKVQVTWPGSMLHYQQAMMEVHYEHFDFDYSGKNRFDWLGNGVTHGEMFDKNVDLAPYIR